MEFYISEKDFKVHKECPGYIPCDMEIAEVIAKLNELGYQTFACCAGHYNPGYYVCYNVNLEELESCKQDKHICILDVREDSFDYQYEREQIHIYIAFKEKYKFDVIPDGFALEEFKSSDYNGLTLESTVNYFDEHDKLRNMFEVLKELENKWKLLEKWAKGLPKNINKGKVK